MVYRNRIDPAIARVIKTVVERFRGSDTERRAVEAFLTRVVLQVDWGIVAVRCRCSTEQEAFRLAQRGRRYLDRRRPPRAPVPEWFKELERDLKDGRI